MNILLVGGTFSNTLNDNGRTYGHPSRRTKKLETAMKLYCKKHDNIANVDCCNGGDIDHLKYLLKLTRNYEIVFWFADADNNDIDIEKIAPKSILVTQEKIHQNSTVSRSDLIFKFRKRTTDEMRLQLNSIYGASSVNQSTFEPIDKHILSYMFDICVFDRTGAQLYSGPDMTSAVETTLDKIFHMTDIM